MPWPVRWTLIVPTLWVGMLALFTHFTDPEILQILLHLWFVLTLVCGVLFFGLWGLAPKRRR